MHLREAGSNLRTTMSQLRDLPRAMRPGAVVGLVLAGVVGIVGLFQFDQRLMLIGFGAGIVVLAINVVVLAVRYWHARNTQPGATYLQAEDVVRLRSPKSR